MSDTTDLALYDDETPTALAQWVNEPTQVWAMADALMMMHPAAKEVGIEGMRTVSQLALLTGANPLPGTNGIHVWKDNNKICTSFGIGFWRGERDRAGGILWLIEPRPMTENERRAYGIAQNATAFICSAALRSAVFSLRAQARQFGDSLSFEDAKRECSATGVGIVMANDYAKKGRPLSWTASERAERDLLRKLVPIGSTARRPVYRDWSPGLFIDNPAQTELVGANGGAYTLEDANDDLGLGPARPVVAESPIAAESSVAEEGEWAEEPAGEEPPTNGNGPRPDDEQIIIEADGGPNGFINAAAAALDIDTMTIKRAMGALQLSSPRTADQRIEAYRQIRGHLRPSVEPPAATQPPLVTDDPDAVAAGVATALGMFD